MIRLKKPKCPACGDPAEWHKTTREDIPRIYCRRCADYYSHPDAPKILLFDIETSTIRAALARPGDQKVIPDQIEAGFYVTSWAGKWLYQKEVFGATCTPAEAKKRNDKRIMGELHKVLKRADFAIHYNGNKFDIKKINWRFLIHNLPPNTNYGSLDLYKKMKEVFGADSLALDYVMKELGYNGKHHHDGAQWRDASNGDADALKARYEYNLNDVWMLEDLYPRVRGWFKTHPNWGAFFDMYQTAEDRKEGDVRCPRGCRNGIISRHRFTLKYQTPAGYFYEVGTCPVCGCFVRKTQRKPGQNIMAR